MALRVGIVMLRSITPVGLGTSYGGLRRAVREER